MSTINIYTVTNLCAKRYINFHICKKYRSKWLLMCWTHGILIFTKHAKYCIHFKRMLFKLCYI